MKAEQAIRCQSLLIINEIFLTCMDRTPLQDQLEKILQIIFSTPWFDLSLKGGIFLRDADTGGLRLVAHQNFSDDHVGRCRRLATGECLCGTAFHADGILFASDCDEAHTIQPEGMTPHAHYCVPLIYRGQRLGVLNLYLAADHRPQAAEKRFLQSVAYILAELIRHRQLEERIKYQAEFDGLTGLPNRSLFRDRLAQALAMAERTEKDVALVFIDLDRFKLVNDTMGHDAGDQLLEEAARRIVSCIRKSDTAARLGGDEFTVILQEVTHFAYVVFAARRILQQLSRPFQLPPGEATVAGSIGIAMFPRDATDLETLLTKADTAMYAAKESGRGTFRFSSPGMNEALLEEMLEFQEQARDGG